jgi:uncharacterized phage protein (TIGR01671 family)
MNQREIKFRAWVTQTFPAPFVNESYMAVQGDPDIETLQSFMHHYGDEKLMQYIGLKGKGSKEIYEGDVIQHNGKKFVCNWSKILGYCFVEINKNLGTFHLDGVVMSNHNHRKQCEIVNYVKYVEVIGNIYENPELLSK